MKKIVFLTLLCALAGFIACPALARAETESIPLYEMTPDSLVTLRGVFSSYEVPIAVPARWQVQSAVLRFEYVNSTTLLADRSRMVISVNGAVLGQVVLDPRSPQGTVEIEVPARLLRAAYNALVFEVTQTNSDDDCVDPNSPDIWTKINLAESSIDIEYLPRPVPLQLSAIATYLFDEKQAYENKVHLVMENMDQQALVHASWLAYGVAARFNYRQVKISVGQALRSGMDNIVLGSRSFVRGVAAHADTGALVGSGPMLGIVPLAAGNGANAAVLVVGDSPQHQAMAAKAFSLLSFPLPDTQYAVVENVEIPEITPYGGRLIVQPDEKYFFKDLGYESHSFWGMNPGTRTVRFMLPSDVRIRPNSYFGLSLHISYGAEMRQDSVINVNINDRFGAAVPLDSETGGLYRGYGVTVPGYLLKQGLNEVSFTPALTPMVTGKCLLIQQANLVVSLFDDSFISVPPMDHWIAMPQLKATFNDGFPFMKWPDWRDTLVVLSERSPENVAAAMNLVAMLAQKKLIAPYGIEFSYSMPGDSDKDLLLVGAYASLPQQAREATPLAPEILFPHEGDTPKLQRPRGFWKQLFHSVVPFEETYETSPGPPPAKVKLQTGLEPDMLLLSEFESPVELARTALVVSAYSSNELLKGVYELWNPGLQGSFTGDTALVHFTEKMTDAGMKMEPEVYNSQTASDYYVGQVTALGGVDYFLHTYPFVFTGLMLAVVFATIMLLLIFLRRRKKRRLKGDA